MIQATKNKYTVETLKPYNLSYDSNHWLTQDDVNMANNYVELIERTRSEETPQIGDRLIYVDKYGSYYGFALIDSIDKERGLLSICEQAYVPFVWEQDGNIRLSVSGGAFHYIDPKKMKFVEWVDAPFKDWGHCGACANGAVVFLAKVPQWLYSEANPLYGDFTTETWRQFYLNKETKPEASNLYQGYGIAFKDEEQYQEFLKDYKATVFPGNWENQIVVWCFRSEYVFFPLEEWEKIEAPIVERRLNFFPEQVKLVKDMDKHISYWYRIDKNSPNQ